ncbi:19070_t:CDS:2, partial [Gigaspora rosea]
SVTTSGPVIVEPFSDLYPRLDIWDLCDNETYRPQFDLFIQSYQSIYDRPYEDMRSYYQVAGIHGLPYTAYDGVTGDEYEYNNDTDWAKGRWGGYCHHGDILFAPWHRPYMLLIESLLAKEAKQIALQYPDNEKEKYVEAAKQLRHPYWDWADEKSINGVPEIFLIPEIEINTPQGKKKVKNPLQSYTLPTDLSYPLEKGENPTDKPNYTIPNRAYNPFTPAGYPTVRHPNSNYEDQYDLLNQNVSIYVSKVFRPGLYQMFHMRNYLHFSDHGIRSDDTQIGNIFSGHPAPLEIVGLAHFASFERTHDALHTIFGGPGGHMAYADLSAFDPMFYFHHVNTDQEIDTVLDENTDLTPFRKTKTEFWKSSDIRYIEKLGYTYLQLEKFKGQDPKKLQNYLLELYKPDPHYGNRFFVKLTIETGKLVGPYSIRVFVDLKNATAQTPITSPHFAGLVSMWRSNNKSNSVVGTVDITATMERLGIRMQTMDNEVNVTTGLLNSTSIFDVKKDINIVPILINGQGVSPKETGVNKVEIFSFEHDKVYQNFLEENTVQHHGFVKF